ncbi:alpha/beta hydrolase [Pseudoxanthomonas beigongshangi]
MRISLWIALVLGALFSPAVFAADAPGTLANRLLDRLQAGDYVAAEAMFSPEMATAVPQDKLKAVWESLPAQMGELRTRGEPKVMPHQDLQVALVRLEFANGAINAQVAVNAQGQIAGFLLQPAPPEAATPVPADASYQERDLAVGAGEQALAATLAMPKGAGPFPAVVLVHGSGPQDRNETIGPNRPFLDIARGLAAQGIAVLRYEKRSKARPQDFTGKSFTVDDEVTDDAVAAIVTLRAQPGVDGKRVFVLGHSQGGMLAPRIAQRSGRIAGLILFAAPARSLLTILPEQNRYLLAKQGPTTPEAQAFLDRLDTQIANVRGNTPDDSTDTPLGLPARYWRSLEAIDPVAEAKALALPLLLLQGGRDFQVVDADWQRWRDGLAGDRRATFKDYPALNHLGIAGEGAGSLSEYQRPGQVDPQLIADTARWIKEH